MINIALCDDNELFLKELSSQIDSVFPDAHSISLFTNAKDLISRIEFFSENSIDIVITDIEMPDINGIEMAKELKKYHPRMEFIFVTNYTDYIQEVFSVNPVHYIIKPVNPEKLSEALKIATSEIERNKKNTVDIISKNKTLRIRLDEIKYIESYTRKIVLHELRTNTEIIMKLDDFQSMLPPFFLRIHKSYLVNMNMIRSISNNRIELFTGEILPVTKAKYPIVKKSILNYFGEKM